MHHDLWMIFLGWVMRKGFDAGWDYLKGWVQAVALFYVVAVFLYFYVATRVPAPRPIQWAYPLAGPLGRPGGDFGIKSA